MDDDKNLSNWIGHIHFTDGSVKEVIVTTSRGLRMEGLQKVLRAGGISSAFETGVRGVVMREDRANSSSWIFGPMSKNTATDTTSPPESLRRTEEADDFRRYSVRVYLSPASAVPIMAQLGARSAGEALSAVLARHGIKSSANCGPFVVKELRRDGDIVRLKYKEMPGEDTPAPQKERIKLKTALPSVVGVPAADTVSQFIELLKQEKTIKLPNIIPIRKENAA